MDLQLGATEDPEGRSQHDHPAPAGRTGAFPLHAVPAGTRTAVCGAAVRVMVDATWPPGAEAECSACRAALEQEHPGPTPREDLSMRRVHPFGQP